MKRVGGEGAREAGRGEIKKVGPVPRLLVAKPLRAHWGGHVDRSRGTRNDFLLFCALNPRPLPNIMPETTLCYVDFDVDGVRCGRVRSPQPLSHSTKERYPRGESAEETLT